MNRITFDIPKPIEDIKTQYDMKKVSIVTSANLYPLVCGLEYEGNISTILEKKREFPIKRKMDVAIEAYTNDMLKQWEKAKKKLLALKNNIKRFKKMDYNNVQSIDNIAKIPFKYKKLFVEVANKYDLNLALLDKIVVNPSLQVNARYDSRKNLIELNPKYLEKRSTIKIGDDEVEISEVVKTFIHEFAHVVWYNSLTEEDRRYWSGLSRFLTREQLTGAIEQYIVGEKTKFDGSLIYSPFYTRKDDTFISVYARFNTKEDFSECFLYYKVAPKTLERVDSKKYAFIEEKIGRKITKYGTSAGADKAWDTKGRGRKEDKIDLSSAIKRKNIEPDGRTWHRGKVVDPTDTVIQEQINDAINSKHGLKDKQDTLDKLRIFQDRESKGEKISISELRSIMPSDSGDYSVAQSINDYESMIAETKQYIDDKILANKAYKQNLTQKLSKQDDEFQPDIEEPNKVRDKIIAILALLGDDLSYTAKKHLQDAYDLGRQKGAYYTSSDFIATLSQQDQDEIKRILSRNDRFLDNFMDDIVDDYDDTLFNMTPAGAVESEKIYSDMDEFDSEFEGVMSNKEHRLGLYAINGLSLGLISGMVSVTGDEYAGGYWHTSSDDRVCDGCDRLDGQWMSYDEFESEYGNNECDGNCRCGELFEPALAPGDEFERMIKYSPDQPRDENGRFTEGTGSTEGTSKKEVVFHGTDKEIKEKRENNYGMMDQLIGLHVAEDKKIAENFIRDRFDGEIKEGGKVLEFQKPSNPKVINQNIGETDQHAISKDILNVAMKKEEFVEWIVNSRKTTPEVGKEIYDSLLSGAKSVPRSKYGDILGFEIVDSLGDYVSNFDSQLIYLSDKRMDIANRYVAKLKEEGYDGISYRNTSPTEIRENLGNYKWGKEIENKKCYVLFNPRKSEKMYGSGVVFGSSFEMMQKFDEEKHPRGKDGKWIFSGEGQKEDERIKEFGNSFIIDSQGKVHNSDSASTHSEYIRQHAEDFGIKIPESLKSYSDWTSEHAENIKEQSIKSGNIHVGVLGDSLYIQADKFDDKNIDRVVKLISESKLTPKKITYDSGGVYGEISLAEFMNGKFKKISKNGQNAYAQSGVLGTTVRETHPELDTNKKCPKCGLLNCRHNRGVTSEVV